MIKCLISPFTDQIVAEMIPEQEIKIFDERILRALSFNGIVVSPEFKEMNHLTGWRVFPSDEKTVFAKAFELFHFTHGLQQAGYVWKDKNVLETPIEEIVKNTLSKEST